MTELEQPILYIAKLEVQFQEANQFEVDLDDLPELLLGLNLDYQKLVPIKKNSFFITFKDRVDMEQLMAILDGFLIQTLQAIVTVTPCCQGDRSSFPKNEESFKCQFEIDCPDHFDFGLRERFLGAKQINLKRIKSICNRESFEGEISFEVLPSSSYTAKSNQESIKMQSLRVLLEGNKKEKFQLGARLVHELAANLQETYKETERDHKLQLQHLFRISRVDYSTSLMELVNQLNLQMRQEQDEIPIEDLQLIDFSQKSKVKKKKPKRETGAAPQERAPEVVQEKYSYESMLSTISSILNEKNQQQSESKKIHLKPVELVALSKSKFRWTNFKEFASDLRRKPEHLQAFVSAELGLETILNQDALRIDKKRLSSEELQSILKRYILEFVKCSQCHSANTLMEKQQAIRSYILQCLSCQSQKTLPNIKKLNK